MITRERWENPEGRLVVPVQQALPSIEVEAQPVGVEAWAFGTGAVLGFLVSLGVMLYLFAR
jgi:hypothetical protein